MPKCAPIKINLSANLSIAIYARFECPRVALAPFCKDTPCSTCVVFSPVFLAEYAQIPCVAAFRVRHGEMTRLDEIISTCIIAVIGDPWRGDGRIDTRCVRPIDRWKRGNSIDRRIY